LGPLNPSTLQGYLLAGEIVPEHYVITTMFESSVLPPPPNASSVSVNDLTNSSDERGVACYSPRMPQVEILNGNDFACSMQ
jgi:hypothetical protein